MKKLIVISLLIPSIAFGQRDTAWKAHCEIEYSKGGRITSTSGWKVRFVRPQGDTTMFFDESWKIIAVKPAWESHAGAKPKRNSK